MLPKFSADAFISAMVRCIVRPRVDAVGGLLCGPAGECNDWLLCRRMVGSLATNEALCLKLEDARLSKDYRYVPTKFIFYEKKKFLVWRDINGDVCDCIRVMICKYICGGVMVAVVVVLLYNTSTCFDF